MKGKYDSLRDSAIHFLCNSEWSNDSTGDVNNFGRFVFRIELKREDVFGCFDQGNTEFDSLIEQWDSWEEVEDKKAFLTSLIGFWLVTEMNSGQVLVFECETALQLISIFNVIADQYNEFEPDEEIHHLLETKYNENNTGE